MGNCCSIGINIPWEQLITECFARQRKTITDLQNDWNLLKATKDDISTTLERPEMVPLEQEKHWLERVAALEGQVTKLIRDYTRESANKCFCGFCPRNCVKSYCLWSKIGPMDQEVLNLQSQAPKDIVERQQRLAPAQLVPTGHTTGMQSMLDEVWSHVENPQDDHVRFIGLHGMGGVGKTTLLKAVNNKLCSSALNFDLQLWIVVSKTQNLVDIQNHIGEKIGFRGDDWKVKSQDEKAIDIYNLLYKKKYILLLDDIWEPFDLVKIGIPLPSLTNKSMIIFTTRSLQVCGQMEATPIQIRCLNDEEAWNLFKKSVGENTLNAHHDIDGLARVAMRECKGLPLALIVIGRAMTLKTTIYDWEYAIQVLQRYTAEFSTIADEVFILLKYSYDNLTNDAIRSCFLYCSLYAEDQEISKSNLVDKWICEGFLGRFGNLDKDRNEGYSYISTLVHASLLEKCSLEKNVKMHDVIRDMALWIAGDSFYVKARDGLTEVPKDVKWEHVEKLSLMRNSFKELNNGSSEVTNIDTFFKKLLRNYELNNGPSEVTNINTILVYRAGFKSMNNNFWKFVPNLKVLDLSNNSIVKSLSKEFCELVSLQYLNLKDTSLGELPNEFRKLVKLKYLNVQETQIKTIPEGVLSSMKELSVFKCGKRGSRFSRPDFLGENLLKEFYVLECLLDVRPDFLSENLVKEFDVLECLQDVTIPATSEVEISNLTSSINLLNSITRLTMEYFSDTTSLDILFLKEMKQLRHLNINHLKNIGKILVGEGQDLETSTIRNQNGFITLRRLEIRGCSGLKNLSWLLFFPNIEYISVSVCDEMQTLVSENEYKLDNEVEPFAKLQTLVLVCIDKLESIYFTNLSFPCLNKLEISGCRNLKRLPFNSNSCDQRRGITIRSLNNKWWNELQWEDETTQTTFSSCFKEI